VPAGASDTPHLDTRPTKLLDVECLRAVAIGYTVLAHFRFAYADSPRWVAWMDDRAHFWSGVDLFFVISGFVIAKSLIPDLVGSRHPEPGGRLKAALSFWMRRIYRLLPSAWLWAFIGVSVVAVAYPEQLRNNVYDGLAALLQVYNAHALACQNGATVCSHLVLGVYWSLSLEEQFYIGLPLVFLAFRERAKWVLLLLLAASVGMSFFWPAPLGFFRWEGFCLGVFFAWVYSKPAVHALIEKQLVAPLGRLTVLATVLMLVALPLVAHGAVGPAPYPLVAVCSLVLVALASFEKNYLGVPAFLRKPMVWLGARSYSIYLIHMPVLVAFMRLSRKNGMLGDEQPMLSRVIGHSLWLAAVTLFILLLSDLNFRFVETRFRKIGHARAGAS
jgi:peptidoglycan/LPS O-acetylase OafA/YrhL